jgi:hypothetical protein
MLLSIVASCLRVWWKSEVLAAKVAEPDTAQVVPSFRLLIGELPVRLI